MQPGTPARRRSNAPPAAKLADDSPVLVQIFWKDSAGQTQTKSKPWQRPRTQQDLSDWLTEYFDLVDEGYRPAGFEAAPRPFRVRLTLNGRILAESHPNPKQREGSHVGARSPLGAGYSVPAVVHDPPQEVKPNCRTSGPRACHHAIRWADRA